MDTTSKMELRDPREILTRKGNARLHSAAQIAALRGSLREFGFVAPLLIDDEGCLVAGHARLEAALAEGFAQVPCVLVEHLSPLQLRAYLLADNRLAELAAWDEELLSTELQELRELGFAVEICGFAEGDVCIEDPREIVEDDFVAELPELPRAKLGQRYQLGQHLLLCGDATVAEDYARLLYGCCVDLLLTDPPYNVDVTGGTATALKIENDCLPEAAFTDFLLAAFCNARAALAPGASFYIWHADGRPGLQFREACQKAALPVRQNLIWVKQTATIGRQDYQWQHEPCLHGASPVEDCQEEALAHASCLYGWRDGAAHLWCSDRKQTTVLFYDKPARSAEHPTMKPVSLFAYLIENSTLPNAAVLDPFAGSGTTLMACEQLGRRALLMEKDPRFVDLILSRWEDFTGEKAVLLDGP